MNETTAAQATPEKWYVASKPDSLHGLVISETTGANIAVSYDPKHAPIIAVAPNILHELELLVNQYEHILDVHVYDEDNDDEEMKEERRMEQLYINRIRSLIAEGKGQQ